MVKYNGFKTFGSPVCSISTSSLEGADGFWLCALILLKIATIVVMGALEAPAVGWPVAVVRGVMGPSC